MTSTFKRKKYTTAIGRQIPSIRRSLGPPRSLQCLPRTLLASRFTPNIRNRVGEIKGNTINPLIGESDLLRNVSPRISLSSTRSPIFPFTFFPLFLPHAHVRTNGAAAGLREFHELPLSSPLLISRFERTSGKPWVVEAARTRRGCIRTARREGRRECSGSGGRVRGNKEEGR